MAIEDIWLSNLKALVTREGGGRRGLRAVADRAGLSEEYVYQLVAGKPKKDGTPRGVGKTAATKIARAFAEDGPESWFDAAPAELKSSVVYANEPAPGAWQTAPTDLDSVLHALSNLLAQAALDEDDSITLQGLLASLVRKPGDQRLLGSIKLMLNGETFARGKKIQA
ncbi:MAG: hypothetical protein Q7U05_01115 [Polaromonas sp.]|nr:hypothetical protein [Polaromonas sp.]